MSRYIDADALREHLQNKLKTDYEMGLYNHGALTESFLRFVERQPTVDVVEVVRCKDCVARCNTKLEPFRCERNNILVYGNSFCSYGKRREQ